MNGDLLSALCGECEKSFLCYRKHTTRAASSIIAGVGGILDLVSHRNKNEVCHEFYHISWCPVLSSFFIIFFIEFADKFLEYRTHSVVIQSWMAKDGFLIILVNGIGA